MEDNTGKQMWLGQEIVPEMTPLKRNGNGFDNPLDNKIGEQRLNRLEQQFTAEPPLTFQGLMDDIKRGDPFNDHMKMSGDFATEMGIIDQVEPDEITKPILEDPMSMQNEGDNYSELIPENDLNKESLFLGLETSSPLKSIEKPLISNPRKNDLKPQRKRETKKKQKEIDESSQKSILVNKNEQDKATKKPKKGATKNSVTFRGDAKGKKPAKPRKRGNMRKRGKSQGARLSKKSRLGKAQYFEDPNFDSQKLNLAKTNKQNNQKKNLEKQDQSDKDNDLIGKKKKERRTTLMVQRYSIKTRAKSRRENGEIESIIQSSEYQLRESPAPCNDKLQRSCSVSPAQNNITKNSHKGEFNINGRFGAVTFIENLGVKDEELKCRICLNNHLIKGKSIKNNHPVLKCAH